MPSRNILREDIPETYYHVYMRGASKANIFQDNKDKDKFISLFDRYLSGEERRDKDDVIYPDHSSRVKLAAYCLMDNHFHLLLYQIEQGGISKLMSSIGTSYSRYFNYRYKRSGPLFESRYKSVRITDDNYLLRISRYIHLNPRYWKQFKYSSIGYYWAKRDNPKWIDTSQIEQLFDGKDDYLQFLQDHRDNGENEKYEYADSR
jgi:putative transposase